MQPDWRIYYDDLSSFDSLMGEPHEAPPEGFVAAVQLDRKGKRNIMHKWDFYRYDVATGQWWGMDRYGLHDNLRRNNVYAYKEGRTVSNETYQLIMTMCDQDLDFPPEGRPL